MQLVWLVTGASRGFGLALVKRILARGDCVIATARDASRFDPLLAQPDTDKTRILTLELDVTWSFDVLQETAKKAIDRWGRVDVVVNNAAYTVSGPSEELGADMFMQFMRTNFAGPINVNNAFLPHMRARKSGTLVLFGGFAVYKSEFMGIGAYSTTKAAVHAYGETLSAELAQFNVRVLVVSPGTFDTSPRMAVNVPARPIADYDAAREELRKRLAMRPRIPNMGDPAKGMDALVDVVRGEGKAEEKGEGGKIPLWLFLGDDSIAAVKARAETLRGVAEEWKEVGTRLGKDDA
ncbi:NAD-P-binding protein [Ganoderma leucocontextum]|nr:NAD-P-binding protein [Ganoderma leucocontextum]